MYNETMNTLKEKCFYCDKPAEYNDLVKVGLVYSMSSVCKAHLRMGLSA